MTTETVTLEPISWVLLTQGDRDPSLGIALDSVAAQSGDHSAVVVINSDMPHTFVRPDLLSFQSPRNLGIPGGRQYGIERTASALVGFLDDDARLIDSDTSNRIVELFDRHPNLGVVSLRLVDPDGSTARRHIPRVGRRGEALSGPVATFLGGACVVRRAAYEEAGGYWPDLFYAHEELDLAWRMINAGYDIRYLASRHVEHPRAPISRHERGWHLTGRNRVMIARRNLPWPLLAPHVTLWLALGLLRAPDSDCRGAYFRGWATGWKQSVPREPIRLRTIWRLTRLGRPPVF